MELKDIKVAWLKPTKGQISIGRKLISEKLRNKNIQVDVMECSGLRFFKSFIKILRSDYDLVIGTTHLGLAVGGLIKILKNKKFVADFVDKYDVLFVDLKGFRKIFGYIVVLMQKFSLKVADAVVVVPKDIYEELRRKRPMVFKTNLCIELENFRNARRSKKILEKFKINTEKPKVIYVGGFSEVYNLDLLLKSMKYLPDFQLIMIGGGKLERDLKKLVRDLNLRNVKFLGYLPNEVVAEIMKSCDIGVTLCEIPRQLKIYEYL
ncbi:glycosyltransferase, partial [Archaeoglobus sp.]